MKGTEAQCTALGGNVVSGMVVQVWPVTAMSTTSMMWLSNVVGEYLSKLDQKPEVAPVHLPRLIDDPVSTLEQAVMDLQIAHEAKEVSCILKQVSVDS